LKKFATETLQIAQTSSQECGRSTKEWLSSFALIVRSTMTAPE